MSRHMNFDERISSLTFVFDHSSSSNDDQVRVCVDDADLLLKSSKERLGIDPPEFFGQQALLVGGALRIGRCACGVIGCDDAWIDVNVSEDRVVWTSRAGWTYAFDRARYTKAVAGASASTEWESVKRRAERFVSALDFSPMAEAGYVFQWASARIDPGKIVLSFDYAGTQRLFDIGWDNAHPEDAVRNVRRWVREFDQ